MEKELAVSRQVNSIVDSYLTERFEEALARVVAPEYCASLEVKVQGLTGFLICKTKAKAVQLRKQWKLIASIGKTLTLSEIQIGGGGKWWKFPVAMNQKGPDPLFSRQPEDLLNNLGELDLPPAESTLIEILAEPNPGRLRSLVQNTTDHQRFVTTALAEVLEMSPSEAGNLNMTNYWTAYLQELKRLMGIQGEVRAKYTAKLGKRWAQLDSTFRLVVLQGEIHRFTQINEYEFIDQMPVNTAQFEVVRA